MQNPIPTLEEVKILLQQGEIELAENTLRALLKNTPNDLEALFTLANFLKTLGRLSEAIETYRQLLKLNPSLAEVYNNLGNTQKLVGDSDAAILSFKKAIELRPNYVQAYFNLANLLKEQSKLSEAQLAFEAALRLKPDFIEAACNLGLVYKALNQMDKAIFSFEQALRGNPHLPDTLRNLGTLYCETNDPEQGITYLEQAYDLYPIDALKIDFMTTLPGIYPSKENLISFREMYLKNLQSLQNQDFYIQDPVKEFGRTNFYLAYQGFNDKEAQEQFAKLFRHIPVGHYIPHPPHPKPRIGFISKFLHPDHTIGKFMRGLIEQLSRKTFQVIEFTLTDIPSATNIIGIPLPILNLQESIRLVQEQEIDLLFYPEIGMDPTTYFLAMSRLAPIQCTTWGHPVTTGIPTIDYFISAECIELETAQEHYTEELIRFENLPTYYKKPIPTVPFKNRNYFGLSESHHLYACPQALFKLHPDMDDIFKEILRQDPLAQIILINHAYEGYKKTLLNRWQTEMPDVMERILFLRRLSYDEFLQLINICDVVLDTLHFGGGNTSFEIFSLGIPIVTLPADYMRGRVTYGCYQKMGINTCIAKTPEEYIEIAIKLGTQSDYRTQIKTEILQKNQVLYENQQAVLEFEDFFLKALQTAQVTTSTL